MPRRPTGRARRRAHIAVIHDEDDNVAVGRHGDGRPGREAPGAARGTTAFMRGFPSAHARATVAIRKFSQRPKGEWRNNKRPSNQHGLMEAHGNLYVPASPTLADGQAPRLVTVVPIGWVVEVEAAQPPREASMSRMART